MQYDDKKRGIYTIPQSQVDEFMNKPIDYNKLIADCLKPSEPAKNLNDKKQKTKTKTKSWSFTI